MSATISSPAGNFRYQAWCNACQDGLNSNIRQSAEIWADLHNSKKHSKLKDA